jgi:hypothetical protein
MLGNLTLFLIMHLCIKMILLALGNQLMLNCIKGKLLLHQMSITFHLRQTQEFKDLCLGTQGACF